MELTVRTRSGYRVSTPLTLEADGSVRAYINWKGTARATGVAIDLRAYHYWNFKDGKVVAEGNYYDAGGLIAAASPKPLRRFRSPTRSKTLIAGQPLGLKEARTSRTLRTWG